MQLRERIPNLSGATGWLNSEITNNDIHEGKPILIHFWSVSCDSCVKSIPFIQSLLETQYDKIQVIAIHMPRSEKDKELDQITRKTAEYKMKQPIAIDNEYNLSKRFAVRHVPAYFLFDGSGLLRYKQSSGSVRLLKKRIDRFVDA
ncbi:redoxin domain-containing protein [Oceanobacillus kapialis]|uniref:Redoxin domain-containing protein n=1 Tax=Oceanobacillus kapialis TaxID=481353 RepID=A0ABW5PYI4_9BACI